MDVDRRFRREWTAVQPMLAAWLYARTGDHALVDDLVQETALAAWDGCARRWPRGAFGAWVMGIARHKLIDHHRRHGREPALGMTIEPALDDAAQRLADELDERRQALRTCLAHLDRRQREMLQRLYAENQDTRAIASDLALSPSNVKVRLHRIRAALRRCIERALSRGGCRP